MSGASPDQSSLSQFGSAPEANDQLHSFNGIPAESRLHPGVLSPDTRRPQNGLPPSFFPPEISKQPPAVNPPTNQIFDANGHYNHGRLQNWHFTPPSTPVPPSTISTTAGSSTTTTAIPGMEEGEYEPEEGQVTTTSGSTTTTRRRPPPNLHNFHPKLMPLMIDPRMNSRMNPRMSEEPPRSTKAPLPVDLSKPHGVDCSGRKGYFLTPGTGCKGYVYCKTSGVAYGFTCPGEYMCVIWF